MIVTERKRSINTKLSKNEKYLILKGLYYVDSENALIIMRKILFLDNK